MDWYRITPASGVARYVASLSGENTTDCSVLAISRCPEPWETVADDGTITTDDELRARQDRDAALNRMSVAEWFDLAVATAKQQVIADMVTAEVISQDAATTMRNSD